MNENNSVWCCWRLFGISKMEIYALIDSFSHLLSTKEDFCKQEVLLFRYKGALHIQSLKKNYVIRIQGRIMYSMDDVGLSQAISQFEYVLPVSFFSLRKYTF